MTQETPVNDEQRAEGETNGAEVSEGQQVTQTEYQAAQVKAQEYLDGWQRARAEFANYKRRIEREMKDSEYLAAGDTIKSLLPVIDDFERAMANLPADLTRNSWINGLSMIQKKFNKFLDDANVTIIDPTGELFDPNQHEAIGTEEPTDAAPSGHVTTTMQRGYLLGERVLRPALVRVAQ